MDRVLVVDFRRSFEGIPEEILSILPLFDGQRTAREALKKARVPDPVAAAMLERLSRLGLVCDPKSLAYPEGPSLEEWLTPPRRLSWKPWAAAFAVGVSSLLAITLVPRRSPPVAAAALAPVAAKPAAAPVVEPPAVPPPAPVVEPPAPVAAAPVADYNKLIREARGHLNRGAYKKAFDAATQASRANPESAEPYLIIGTVEQQNGRIPLAEAAYKRYLQLSPKGEYAAEIRSILRTLH